MATVKQNIARATGAGSAATQYKKSARAFGLAGKFGARGKAAAKKGNVGSMGG